MPYYIYTARDKKGRQVKSQGFAANKQQLIKNLQEGGFLILSMKETSAAADYKKISLHKKAKTSDLILFAKEFAVLLENGIPIMEALDVLLKQMNSVALMNATRAIRKDLENGSTLSNAISKHPHVFGNLWQYLTEAGEASGQLPFILKQMVMYMESSELIRKKTVTALLYPGVLMLAAISAVLLFTLKIVPIFKGIYISFGAQNKLPPLTMFVIGISDILIHYYMIIIVIIVLLALIVRQIIATKAGKRLYESVLMHTPAIGNLYTALAIERFASTLKVLLKSGIPIIKAMEMASRTSQSMHFAQTIEEAKAKVTAGLSFSEALQHTALFPPLAVQLIIVAEKTGNYAGMFEEIAKYYNEVLDTAISRFTVLIEPVMLVLMGAVIGGLIISLYLPIFGLAKL